MRRITVTLALVLMAGIWPVATGGVAHGATAAQPTAAASLRADFNHDGAEDLAVGVPSEDVGTIVNAGSVNVLYGSASGLTGTGGQLFTQDSPGVPGSGEPGDIFGDALAAAP